MITVGLLWHSLSSDNLGVGALTESQIAIFLAAAKRAGVNIEFLIFGTEGKSSYVPVGVKVHKGSRISIKQILMKRSPYLKELERCDIVFDIGEGDSFTDIYGLKRFLFIIVSKIAILTKGKPLVLSPQTIGPFNGWLPRLIAAMVMRRCDKVFARDGLSAAYLKLLNIHGNTDEVIDVAFRLPFIKQRPTANNKIHIGLNVSGLLFSGGYSGSNQFGLSLDYPALIRRLLSTWANDPNIEVWLIPHVIPDALPKDDDRVAIAQLLTEFSSVKRAPDFKSPSEAKSFISGMDFVTGARMHACIAALSSGVAVVPVAYSRKFNGLFNSLDYPYFVDGKVESLEKACETILDGFARREKLTECAVRAQSSALCKLVRYEDYLVEQFITLANEIGEREIEIVT